MMVERDNLIFLEYQVFTLAHPPYGSTFTSSDLILDIEIISMYRRYFKRFSDILLTLPLFIGSLPIQILAYCFLRYVIGVNPIFRQQRPGKNGEIFSIYKFSSMTNETDANGKLLPDGERLKWWGKFLRKSSIDELPQFINILKGEMSLIGPRPLLPEYIPYYTPFQARRHEVRPGVTGLAQVMGRNSISWQEKFRLDVEYIDTMSFFGDLKIIILTIKMVLLSKGVTEAGTATFTRYTGNPPEYTDPTLEEWNIHLKTIRSMERV